MNKPAVMPVCKLPGTMSKTQILDSILTIAKDVFDEDDVSFGPDTPFDEIEDWDSLSHVHMIVRMEKEFGMRFEQTELRGLVKVEDLLSIVERKRTK